MSGWCVCGEDSSTAHIPEGMQPCHVVSARCMLVWTPHASYCAFGAIGPQNEAAIGCCVTGRVGETLMMTSVVLCMALLLLHSQVVKYQVTWVCATTLCAKPLCATYVCLTLRQYTMEQYNQTQKAAINHFRTPLDWLHYNNNNTTTPIDTTLPQSCHRLLQGLLSNVIPNDLSHLPHRMRSLTLP